MVGSHTLISRKRVDITENDVSFLLLENWFKVDSLYKDKYVNLVFSHYEGYPFDIFDHEHCVIIFEGMIYNYSEQDINENLKKVADSFCKEQDYLTLLKKLVSNFDGDYIIQIYDKKNNRYLLFNDCLGRIPIYYFINSDKLIISRDIKFILEFIPTISFNKSGIIENLMLGFTLGDKTIVDEVNRLYSGEYIYSTIGPEMRFTRGRTSDLFFDSKKQFWNKKKSLLELRDLFVKATKNRVDKLHEKGYKIISDLSGGYDSRAVIGALCKFDKKVDYYTYEYIQDESNIANNIFKELDEPGYYYKLNSNNLYDIDNVSQIVYNTDGLGNFFTSSICYNDTKQLKDQTQDNIAHFGGFGGEFIRHPERRYYNSIVKGFQIGLYNTIKLDEVCSLLNLDFGLYKSEIEEYFNSYQESKKDSILKHYYYEYYRNHVGYSGEERNRIFHWYIQPLWCKDFINTIFNKIPLKWTGYTYFIKFLNLIDPRLLEVNIYNSCINLTSKESIANHEQRYRKKFSKKYLLYNMIKEKLPFVIDYYKKFKVKSNNKDVETDPDTLIQFYQYYNKLDKCRVFFHVNEIEKHINKVGGKYNYLVTLAMYLYEIEKRYNHKIVIDE